METFSALLAICAENSPVPGEFTAQRPVTRSFDVIFDLRLNKRLSKQWWGWWFETLSHPLWRHRNGANIYHCTSIYALITYMITSVYLFRHDIHGAKTNYAWECQNGRGSIVVMSVHLVRRMEICGCGAVVEPFFLKDVHQCVGLCKQWLQAGLSWHSRVLTAHTHTHTHTHTYIYIYTDDIPKPHVEPHIHLIFLSHDKPGVSC